MSFLPPLNLYDPNTAKPLTILFSSSTKFTIELDVTLNFLPVPNCFDSNIWNITPDFQDCFNMSFGNHCIIASARHPISKGLNMPRNLGSRRSWVRGTAWLVSPSLLRGTWAPCFTVICYTAQLLKASRNWSFAISLLDNKFQFLMFALCTWKVQLQFNGENW